MPPGTPPGMPPGATGMRKYMDAEGQQGQPPMGEGQPPQAGSGAVLPEPSDEDIQKFDLEIRDFSQEMDDEEIDRSEEP